MAGDGPDQGGREAPRIDTTVPHSARVWNYWLGGRDNYPVDQEVGDHFREVFPGIVDLARTSRAFLARAVRYLAGDAGVRQFLDVGTGLPTVDNTHEVAQRVAPDSRIVYVDNDPLVLAHAHALLTSTPEGVTTYIDTDLHDPATILAEASKTLDLDKPVALVMMQTLGHVQDYDEALSIVRRIMEGLPPGSYFAMNDSVDDPQNLEATGKYNASGAAPYRLHTEDEIAHYFDGLELVDPGIVSVSSWRPEALPFGSPPDVPALCGVARKP
jgi:hypothetical protein